MTRKFNLMMAVFGAILGWFVGGLVSIVSVPPIQTIMMFVGFVIGLFSDWK